MEIERPKIVGGFEIRQTCANMVVNVINNCRDAEVVKTDSVVVKIKEMTSKTYRRFFTLHSKVGLDINSNDSGKYESNLIFSIPFFSVAG